MVTKREIRFEMPLDAVNHLIILTNTLGISLERFIEIGITLHLMEGLKIIDKGHKDPELERQIKKTLTSHFLKNK